MIKKKQIVSCLQFSAALLAFALFFTLIPWATAHPISRLDIYPEMKRDYPPSEWAKYFTVGAGKPTYFRTSPRDEPVRAAIHCGALVSCLAFLVVSALYYTKLEAGQSEDGLDVR